MAVVKEANPICNLLRNAIDMILQKLAYIHKMQQLIKKELDIIISLTDLGSALSLVPNLDLKFDPSQINAIIKSCGGKFPDIPTFNLEISKMIKTYLMGLLPGNPLGKISALNDSLKSLISDVDKYVATGMEYTTCLKNICDILQGDYMDLLNRFTNANAAIKNFKAMSDVNEKVVSDYDNRVGNMQNTATAFANNTTELYTVLTPEESTQRDKEDRYSDSWKA